MKASRRRLGRSLVLAVLVLSVAVAAEAQAVEGVQCFVLDIADPDVLYMDVQGEMLVLTEESLEGSPGAKEGARAYIGVEQWRKQERLRASSWYWAQSAPDSIRVGFVLPLSAITWSAQVKPEGLEGEVTYLSDDGEPSRTSPFRGTRVQCASEGLSEHAV